VYFIAGIPVAKVDDRTGHDYGQCEREKDKSYAGEVRIAAESAERRKR